MKMRYLVVRLHSQSGREMLGSNQTFLRYANVRNVIRFGLILPAFEPGAYRIYTWPEGGQISTHYVEAYKRV